MRASAAPRPAAIGVLMLSTRFPRPVGDIGNRNGFEMPLLFERVAGASVERVVSGRALGAEHLEAVGVPADTPIGALVLECTNLPHYAAALRASLGLPVFDARTLVAWLWSAYGAPGVPDSVAPSRSRSGQAAPR